MEKVRKGLRVKYKIGVGEGDDGGVDGGGAAPVGGRSTTTIILHPHDLQKGSHRGCRGSEGSWL